MTPLATGRPGTSPAHLDTGIRTGVRVSVREIRETAFRAIVAAGASGGEAATAAELVVLGEVLDGAGILALVDELDRVPGGRVPISRDGGPIDVLRDPADRGPLLLGPLAADLAVAGARPVLLPGSTWSTVVEWILISTAVRTSSAVLAAQVRADGSLGASALATRDGAIYRASHPGGAFDNPYAPSIAHPAIAHGEGILLSRWNADEPPRDLVPARSSVQHDENFTAALSSGLSVDPGPWSTAYAASRRFRVPEHTTTPAP